MRSKQDIKMTRLCTPGGGGGGAVGIVGEAIPDENMPFYVRLYVLLVVLLILLDFRL